MTGQIIGFAHRGAPQTRNEQNTLPAFTRALAMGAGGLESDIGLTADGIPVLLHTGFAFRRGPHVGRSYRQQLPEAIPSLADLYEQCGTDFELSLDMAEPSAADAVVSIARQYGALDRLWLTYWRLPTLERWRRHWPDVRLIYPTISALPTRSGRLIDRLADARINALNLHFRIFQTRVVKQAHARNLLVFAWGMRQAPALQRVVQRGADGVFCDDVDAMVRLLSARP